MKNGNAMVPVKAARAAALQSCPICAKLGEDYLRPIGEISRERVLEKGEFLAHEGDSCKGFFLVLSGRVRVFKIAPNGRERVLLVAEPGMIFGEDAIFGDGTFLQNAVAAERTRVLTIPRVEFLNMLKRDPNLSLRVIESLCAWIRKLATSVENVTFLTAEGKVASYLLELHQQGGGEDRVLLPIKKKEIADQVGIAPETLSRIFAGFQRRGLIDVNKKIVTYRNTEKLRELVEAWK